MHQLCFVGNCDISICEGVIDDRSSVSAYRHKTSAILIRSGRGAPGRDTTKFEELHRFHQALNILPHAVLHLSGTNFPDAAPVQLDSIVLVSLQSAVGLAVECAVGRGVGTRVGRCVVGAPVVSVGRLVGEGRLP